MEIINNTLLGIDLGTTNTVASFVEDGKPKTIVLESGKRLLPSVVSFKKDGSSLVGDNAFRQRILNPEDTFYSVKRFIGRQSSTISKDEISDCKFKIDLSDNQPKLKSQNVDSFFEVSEISAQVLLEIKRQSEKFLDQKITQCVITVPAYFDNNQRTATKQAAEIAGLDVINLINEPTAAALAYTKDRGKDGKVLICDLGGGTFDISLVDQDLAQNFCEVLASTGDTKLGGDDFTLEIYKFLINEIKSKNPDFILDKKTEINILDEAETIKCRLSLENDVEVIFPFLQTSDNQTFSFETNFSRDNFEFICEKLFNRIEKLLKSFLENQSENVKDLDFVVLVGGSSRISKFQALIKKITNKDLEVDLNPDEIVSNGAAIFAEVSAGTLTQNIVVDLTPLSLGTSIEGDIFDIVVEANSQIPLREERLYTTTIDGQDAISIDIYQGERLIASDNTLIGEFILEGIEIANKGDANIVVIFEIDLNGMLTVTAEDQKTLAKKNIKISNSCEIPLEVIEEMKEKAKLLFNKDSFHKNEIQAKLDIRDLIELQHKLNLLNQTNEVKEVLLEINLFLEDPSNSKFTCKTLISKARNIIKETKNNNT